MRPTDLLAEGARTSWAQKVPSALTAVVVAIMCFTALATVGRATANDRELAASLEDAGARLLTITDGGGLGVVTPALLGVVQRIEGVETAVALSPAIDVYSGLLTGGPPVPLWQVSDVGAVASPELGRTPLQGEATVSASVQDTLSLTQPAGYVEGRDQTQFPVVSRSVALPGFEDLDAGVLVQATTAEYTQLRVVIRDVRDVAAVQRSVLSTFGPVDPSKLSVDSPRALNVISELVQGQLGRYNQSLLGMILGMGAIFIAIVVLSDVMLHRRELGRRRALGATRADLSALTVVRTMIPALVGGLVGCIVAWTLFRTQDVVIPLGLSVAIGWLAVGAAGLAAAVPAIWASTRDPVAVLRTP